MVAGVKHILALDQGTTSSRAIVFDHSGNAVASAQQELRQIFPKPGRAEHERTENWPTPARAGQAMARQRPEHAAP